MLVCACLGQRIPEDGTAAGWGAESGPACDGCGPQQLGALVRLGAVILATRLHVTEDHRGWGWRGRVCGRRQLERGQQMFQILFTQKHT